MFKYGSINFYKNIGQFSSWLQRVVNKTIYSHNGLIAGQISETGRSLEFEANLQVGFTTWRSSVNTETYEWIGVADGIIHYAMHKVIEEYEEKSYGYISWLAIFLRRMFEKLGFKKARGWSILWGWGIHCSELIYYYLLEICTLMHWEEEINWLREFNSNLFTPQDTRDFIDEFNRLKEVV